ncbi:Nn.00g075400.m01.CDS01 [Neocucurbitaria sp. VM-36]
MGMGDYSPGSVWYYAPNKVAPIIFIILFLISGSIHAWQTIKHKSWRTTLLLPWAALLMVSGFGVRLAGAYNTDNLAYLIASTVLIMSGPPVYALINYIILSRILYYIPYLAPMHPGRVATTFIGLDGVCEILIGNGAWRMANSSMTEKQRQMGSNMVMASLCLQATLFGLFGLLGVQFHRRAKKAGVLTKDLKAVLLVMYVSATIVTIRCIYRLVEYIEGWKSSIYQNEVYFWIFEAVIMFVNTALLNIWHPGKRLPKSNSVFLARDGVTERRGPGWADDRPWIVTVFDPFDIWGLVKGNDKKTQFWDMSDAELERARLDKKKNKRSVAAGAFDPFHLWGERGYIGKHLAKNKRAGERGEENVQEVNVEDAKSSGRDTRDVV